MPVQDLKAQIAHLPEQPGVYLFANQAGETIYIGKARSLRDRVRTYLGGRGVHPKTDALLDEAFGLDVIVTDSVVEALALENHLIKERGPRYNVLLRDDKNYPYLQLTTNEAFPRVLVARRVERDGTYYAGPFMPASLARRTMGLTHRLFGIRSCNEVITGMRDRPCLEYDIKRCIAPCVAALCSQEQYAEAVQRTQLFFEGKNEELIARLTDSMTEAASGERYEEAAHLRDAARTVQTLRDRQQKMATARLGDRDAFGLHMGPAGAVVHVFLMREGRVLERVELAANEGISGSAAEILQASVEQFYEDRPAPAEVHLSSAPEDSELLEAWLSARAGRRVHVLVPKRGEKRGLVELAIRNARVAYQARLIDTGLSQYDALETLRATLALPAIPRRIECFDISTIQGSETVASMVVCEDGKMRKSDYRKYRIAPATHSGSDDFAAMKEVVTRRYRKLLEQGGPFPDLILIDGGKGQLSVAYGALRELGLANLVAVGIAKREELIFTRDRDDPIVFSNDDPALRLVQQIRDEAHRFAVTFHRKARTLRDLRSELDAVAGIGPRRRKTLLIAFGSLAGVRRASREELTAAVGAKTADAVLDYFAEKGH
ncbi:MAG TPA: excinuclease ABC subunit UvrC [Vicinamibacterales bacterium]|nr:excinuclease ABC subunit UvrC [Vicinamibacterales bacterium]